MNTNNEYNDPRNSLALFGLGNKLDFLIKLHNLRKLPKVLMISGKKGVGKFTLINHFLTYVYDKNNYDLKNRLINNETQFYKQYLDNIFPNIIYLSGANFKNVKVDDIRDLKLTILKRWISPTKSLISLYKVPSYTNFVFFFLSKPVLK